MQDLQDLKYLIVDVSLASILEGFYWVASLSMSYYSILLIYVGEMMCSVYWYYQLEDENLLEVSVL